MRAETIEMAQRLVSILQKNGLTVATAESCTGGLVCAYITAVSGASNVINYGVCTYSNEMKTKELTVKPKILEKYGAVSYQTASMMAKGVRRHAESDIGVSVTGIAGPTGGSIEKPVGTVYIAYNTKKHKETIKLSILEECGNDRDKIRERTVQKVFEMLLYSDFLKNR